MTTARPTYIAGLFCFVFGLRPPCFELCSYMGCLRVSNAILYSNLKKYKDLKIENSKTENE